MPPAAQIRISTLALAALICATVTGCSPPSSHAPPAAVSTPEFSGTHQDLVRELWLKTDDAQTREVLRDEIVSDLEWESTKQRFTQCITNKGMTVSDFADNGAYTIAFQDVSPDVGHAEVDRCSDTSGIVPVGILRNQLFTNPDNLDSPTLMSACLVRAKVVAPDYSPEDYRRETAHNSGRGFDISYIVSKTNGDSAAFVCTDDPTHSFQ